MNVKTFGVIGAGQMGNGIAQVAAMSGLSVIMNDIKEEFVQKGLAAIDKNLARNVEKGKMSAEEKSAIMGRISASVDLADMAKADFVVEAATENEPIKYEIFRKLDAACAPGVIQYLLHPHRPYRGQNQTPGQSDRHAFHEPGAGDETGGGDPWVGHIRRYLQNHLGPMSAIRENSGGSQ